MTTPTTATPLPRLSTIVRSLRRMSPTDGPDTNKGEYLCRGTLRRCGVSDK